MGVASDRLQISVYPARVARIYGLYFTAYVSNDIEQDDKNR